GKLPPSCSAYTLHDALPISDHVAAGVAEPGGGLADAGEFGLVGPFAHTQFVAAEDVQRHRADQDVVAVAGPVGEPDDLAVQVHRDRKSTPSELQSRENLVCR